MPISAQQWRLAVGQANAFRSIQPRVTGQPKMKLTSLDVLLFILTALLGVILSGDGGRGTGEKRFVHGGGTVGELAPSLLTAPWRKELLILAGDVETNPGPWTNYSQLCKIDLELVMEELRGVEEKWESIGREVFKSADNSYPTNIRTSHSTSHGCMREVLRKRLQDPNYTSWGDIIDAVRSAREPQVADNLKAKYIPDMLEESDLDSLTQELRPAQNKWRSLGEDFNFNSGFLDMIHGKYSYPDACLREMLREQLKETYGPTTWRNIVDALRSPDVRESQLADELEAKYCPNLLSVSLLAQELTAVCEKWQHIGEKLGVEQYSLSGISTNHSDPGDCLREVLWQRLRHGVPTWKDMVAVLRTPHIGASHLADHLESKYCSTGQQILQEALEKGYVDCHIWKVLITGAAGSGKTSLKHRLFGEEPPSLRCSTALAEAAVRAISREIVGTSVTGWFRVTYEELMEMLGGALKAGVPMEKSPSGAATGVVAHKESTEVYITHETKQPKIATAPGPIDSSPNPSTEATAAPLPVLTSNVSAQVSSSKQELVQLVEKSEGSQRFLELQWIHFIDSGGQPQFHEVLPAFIRNTTATIFVMKLSEKLDENPMIEYYDRNGELCGKSYLHALSNEQMLQCCVRTIHSRLSTGEGKHSKTLVVGTHRDLESTCSETRVEKNRKLVDMLMPILQGELVLYSPRLQDPEVIFPINAQTPAEEDHQVCALIRKQVEDKKCAPPPYKIPIGWFLLEQDVIKASKGGVISKKQCISIASLLNIDAEALTAALKYFDDLNVFLYYPSLLSEVVFSDPQILLNKVTELVHFSYSLQSDRPPLAVEGKWLQFRDKGIVTTDMFQDERFSAHYIPGLFSPVDLIELFKHLLIVAPMSSKEYFMPSLLRMISSEKLNKHVPPPSSSSAPLLVHFPAGCAQNGVFCALVVYLLSKCQWKFACDVRGNPLCVSRSCIHFQFPGKPASIALVDCFSYFEVHVTMANTMYSKVWPAIREAIFSGLKAAAESLRYNNSTPVPAFLCKCSSFPHAAIPVIDDEQCYLMCSKSTNYGPLKKQHAVWLDVKLPVDPPKIVQHPSSQSVPTGAQTTFTTEATGDDLTFQWQKNGSNVHYDSNYSGTDTNTLSIRDVKKSHTGCYRCLVKNEVKRDGEVSEEAKLTVCDPPKVTEHPKSQTVPTGEKTTLKVEATGDDLTLQWQKDGSDLKYDIDYSGTDTNTLSIRHVKKSHGGWYRCLVMNEVEKGGEISEEAHLTIFDPPKVTDDPKSQSVPTGEETTFVVEATGDDLTFQWRKNDSNLKSDDNYSGTGTNTLRIQNVKKSHAGCYRCLVMNDVEKDGILSGKAQLSVFDYPEVTEHPKRQSVPSGRETIFKVEARGDDLMFQWQKNGRNLKNDRNYSGTDTNTLSIRHVMKSDEGFYRCLVMNEVKRDGILSIEAQLSVYDRWKPLKVVCGIFIIVVLIIAVIGMLWWLPGNGDHTTGLVQPTAQINTKLQGSTFNSAAVVCTSISRKQELDKAVAEIGDWEALCEHLGTPQTKLRELRFSEMDVRTKKSRCLEAYLDTGRACWEHVVKVVAEYPIENKRLAKEIAETHGIVYSGIVKEEL